MSSHPYVQNFLATLKEERITSSIDWTEELLLAIEAGDCRAVDIAWSRAGVLVQEEAIESLLLNALCAGKVIDTYQAAGILGRDLREDEVMILTEGVIFTKKRWSSWVFKEIISTPNFSLLEDS